MCDLAEALRKKKDTEIANKLYRIISYINKNFNEIIKEDFYDVKTIYLLSKNYYNYSSYLQYNSLFKEVILQAKKLEYNYNSYVDPKNEPTYKFNLEYFNIKSKSHYFDSGNRFRSSNTALLYNYHETIEFIVDNLEFFDIKEMSLVSEVIFKAKVIKAKFKTNNTIKNFKNQLDNNINIIENSEIYKEFIKERQKQVKKLVK